MATLTTLASFSGADGAHPTYGNLLADADGNLYGTTLTGGTAGDGTNGTVFELVNTGSGYTLQTLASLDFTNGSSPWSGLTMDAQGNLYGTAQSGGAGNQGTVFELANTGSGYQLQTVVSFAGANGASPIGGLLADASGNLFGVTTSGSGSNANGTVFELVKGASGFTLQTLYAFDPATPGDGAKPDGTLIMDAQGNLFGTTSLGGATGQGTVFELAHGASGYTLNTLGSFSGYLYSGLTMDANGDLFGTTNQGGAAGMGTVFELVHGAAGYSAPQTLVTFDYFTTGGLPTGGLTIDASGNLYGTTSAGGVGNWGTVFELANTGTGYDFEILHNFSGGLDGASPKGALILGADGNLYGTTASGGTSNIGTVFEITLADASTEQGNLHLTVNSGSPTPIGESGAAHVGFTIAGLLAGDTGLVTFTDQANHTVVVQVAAGQTHYEADFSGLTDGAVSASLQVATNTGGISFTPVAGNTVSLDTAAPGQPVAPGDDAVQNGWVNAVHDTAGQTLGGTVDPGVLVTIFDNGVQVGAVVADGDGAWSHSLGVLADGVAHSFTITATDAAGNVSAYSDPLTFTVDTTSAKPAVPADDAVQDGWVNAAHDTAGQAIGGVVEAGASVAVFDHDVHVATVVADGAGAWSYAVGVLADGSSHSFTVTATDLAGNISDFSDPLTFTVDASAPSVSAPADASVIHGYVNALNDGAGQTIGGATEAGASVAIYDNGSQVGAVTADAQGAWSYQVGVLADGSSHSYRVTAADAAGNVSGESDPLTFTVDTVAPAALVQGVAPDAGGGFTVSGAAEAGSTVTLFDGAQQLAVFTTGQDGAWSYDLGVLVQGSSHSYAVTATDAAGNSSLRSAAQTFVVDNVDTIAPAAPTGLADAAISQGYVNAARDTAGQTLTGAAEKGALVTVSDHGVALGTTMADATGAWSYSLGVLADGVRSLTATATDAVGNTSGSSAALVFTVDATAPVPVVANVTNAAKGQSTVSGTSEAGSRVTLFDGGQQVGVTTAAADGTWSVTLKLNGGQVHQFTETAVDLAGNTGTSAGTAYWANPANKVLAGGEADDVLVGVKGDTLIGGGGHNHFVFDTGMGQQTVTDFVSGSDQLWFGHGLFADAAAVLAHAQRSGADTVLTASGGDQIVLHGVTALHAGDFMFF